MILIVGAGVTGLSLSVFLDELGVEHQLIEGASAPGGVIWSTEVEGRVLDHGPQRTRVTPEVGRLIALLGLEERTVAVPRTLPLFVVRGGQLRRVPFTAGELVRTDLLSLTGKMRLLLEPFTAPPGDDETVGDFLTRKFGAEAYRGGLGPLFGGLYGSDPGEMYARHALRELLGGRTPKGSLLLRFLRGGIRRTDGPEAVSFRRGMQELTDAMAAHQAHRLTLDARIERLAPDASGGWILEGEGGTRWNGTQVVLTVPSAAAAALLGSVAPDAAGRLSSLRYNELAIVHLLGDAGALVGLGYQVGYGEPLRTRGVTWSDSAFPDGRDGVYTAFLGGARDPAILNNSDAEIGETAALEFEQVTGVRTRPVRVTRTKVPAWDRSWAALDGLTLPLGIELCTNYESRIGIPGRIARTHQLARRLAER
jgi:oxygen-dependent protoporphyrinogen oxidase